MLDEIPENELTEAIIGAAIEVHKVLGPGLKEEVYEAALAVELGLRGIECKRQVPVKVTYKGVDIGDSNHPKRIDLLVRDAVVVECKALASARDPVFRAQCLTYLKMTGLRTGLVLNFGRPTLKEGIDRVLLTPLNSKPKTDDPFWSEANQRVLRESIESLERGEAERRVSSNHKTTPRLRVSDISVF